MKQDWEKKRLGDVCEIYQPKTISTKEMATDGKYLVYGANGIIGRYYKFNHEEPQLLITCRGATCGSVNVSTPMSWITGNAMVVRPKDDLLNIKFLEYLFRGGIDISKTITGAAQPQITRTNLSPLYISFPKNLTEQQRIVAILDEAFAAISQAKENAEKNLQNARELFDSYLQSVFANPGDGWEEKTFDEVCEITSKLIDPRKSEYGDLFHVGGANIETKNGNLIELKTAIEEGLISGKFLFDETMVLYSKIRPYLMKVARPEFEGLCSADIYPLFPKPDQMFRDFLFYLLLTPNFTEYAIKGSDRAGMPKVNRNHLFQYSFSLPPLEKQISIVEKLDSLSAETKKLENIYRQKVNDLDELKKSILQKAFNGELTASNRVSNVIEFPVRIPNISTTDLQAGIVGIGLQRHQEKGNVLTFGHVKAEKIVHLAESVLEIELDRFPVKDAAGPNDFPHLKKVESRAEKAGFFYTNKQGHGYTYTQGNQFDNLIEKTKTALNDKTAKLINLIDLLVPMDTQQTELVATVYAAWNNLLIDNLPINDEAIVTEARENWHKDKLNIQRERFFKTIIWMKQNNLVPNGKGKKVSARPTK